MNATFQLASRFPTAAQLAQPNLRLRIGAHVVDVGALRIVSRPDAARLTSKAAAVLIELVRHAGDTVTRDQLLDRVWTNRVTTPDVLTQAIKELRRAFVDDAKPSQYIETVPKVGYRLIAPVSIVSSSDAALAVLPANDDEAANSQWPVDDEMVAVASEPARRKPSNVRIVFGAVAILAIFSIVAIWFVASNKKTSSVGDVWKADQLRLVTSDPGPERRPQLSPDGTRFVYVKFESGAKFSRIYLRGLQPSQPSTLTSQIDGFETTPVWSPDGSEIAFARLGYQTCRVVIISSSGGGEREVAPCQDYSVNYFDWAPDGKSLISAERIGGTGDLTLENWDIATGTKTPLKYDHAVNDQDLEAHYSPDGKWISFRRGVAPYSDLYVTSSQGGAVRQLTHIGARIYGYTWTSSSDGLIFSSIVSGEPALYSIALGGGDIHPLGVSPGLYPNRGGSKDLVLYEIPRIANGLTAMPIGSDTKPERIAASTGTDAAPSLSPDESKIVFASDRTGTQQVWLFDENTNTSTPLTEFANGLLINPTWNPDGKHVLVTHRQPGKADLIEIDLNTLRQRVINRSDERALSGTYGPEPNSFLITVGPSSPSDALVYVQHAGEKNESRRTLVQAVAHVEFDSASRTIYYTKTAQRGLFRRGIDDADETFVTPRITSILMDGWRVVGGKIWYVGDMEFNPTEFRELDPRTGAERSIGTFPFELIDANFSVNAKQDRLIVVPLQRDDTDVGAFRLTKSAAG